MSPGLVEPLSLTALLLVGAGGALGGAFRFGLSAWAGRRFGEGFPWGTLVVNLTGALISGLLAGWFVDTIPVADSALSLTVFTGFLGSYTTVSSFSLQTLRLVHDGKPVRAVGNGMASVAGCLAAAALGFGLASLAGAGA